VSARVHEAREAIAHREEEDPAPFASQTPAKKTGRRDLTLLLLVGVTGIAALIYWLTQRPPTPTAEPVPSRPTVAATADRTPPVAPPVPVAPAPTAEPTPIVTAIAAAPPPPPAPASATPIATATAAPTVKPAVVVPKDPPSEPAKPRPAPPKAAPKKVESADPYG